MPLPLSCPMLLNFMTIADKRPLKKSSWELFFMNFLPIMYSVIHILFKPLQISPMWPPLIINVSSFCPVLDFLWHNTLELTAPASFRIECGHLSKHWCFLSRNCMKFIVHSEKYLSSVLLRWLLNQIFKLNFININFYVKNNLKWLKARSGVKHEVGWKAQVRTQGLRSQDVKGLVKNCLNWLSA